METKKKLPTYTAEFRDRAVRLAKEQRPDYQSNQAVLKVLPSYRTLNEKVQVRVFYATIWAVYSAHRSKASERE